MKQMIRRLRHFFFAPMTADGFGLLRISWAAVVLLFMLGEWTHIGEYYSEAGILPASIQHLVLRDGMRFTIFTWVTSPDAVFAVYLAFLVSLTCMMLGIFPRISTIASVLLMFSFHERNHLPLGGGETFLRTIGFILMIAPGIGAFSLERVSQRLKHGKTLPPVRMPRWPMVLLTWQLIVLYTVSIWYKLLGEMWIRGTAIASIMLNPHFSHIPDWLINDLRGLSPFLGYATLVFEAGWIFLLIPASLYPAAWGKKENLKRSLIVAGIIFHGSVLFTMDVGSLSFAMLISYFGLLDDEDFVVLKRLWKRLRRNVWLPRLDSNQ